MAATNAFKQAMADAATARGAVISLHSADPGTTGANELAGGGYAAKLTAWGASVIVGADAVATGSVQQFDVEGGDAALWFGGWAGTVGARGAFQYGKALVPGVTLSVGANGKVDVTPTYTFSQA